MFFSLKISTPVNTADAFYTPPMISVSHKGFRKIIKSQSEQTLTKLISIAGTALNGRGGTFLHEIHLLSNYEIKM